MQLRITANQPFHHVRQYAECESFIQNMWIKTWDAALGANPQGICQKRSGNTQNGDAGKK